MASVSADTARREAYPGRPVKEEKLVVLVVVTDNKVRLKSKQREGQYKGHAERYRWSDIFAARVRRVDYFINKLLCIGSTLHSSPFLEKMSLDDGR